MTNPPQRIGNYKIEKPLGKGGMSHVWLARHQTLDDRLVAVKLLLSQDSESIERFTREAHITSRLRHENIVQIYDHGYQPPFHYTIMEYVAGGALREQLKGARALPLETALKVFRSAGLALDYAHAHGVVHRDVSPGNILIERGTARVLLTDFGIARESGKANVTTIGKVMGTPGYLSPEHASSATAVTHLSDIFSLGVVLFEMLSGSLPWDHYPGMPPDSNGGPFVPPASLRARGIELPAEVDRIIQTMLALDPAKRYPTALSAIEDLERLFNRHTAPTQVVVPGADGANGRKGERASMLAAPLLSTAPQEQHPVERALALDLLKGPMQEARRRAEALSDPAEIGALLDAWSAEGRFRRRLGRQAMLRRVTSTNVYFYTMRVLYETRAPAVEVEEPDHKAAPVPLEKEVDRWGVELPPPAAFVDTPPAPIRLPGSLRVTVCKECAGVGRLVCQRCEGRGRILVSPEEQAAQEQASLGGRARQRKGSREAIESAGEAGVAAIAPPPRAAGPALVPCPDCLGSAGLRCKHCDGVGRMLQHKTTLWSRKAAELTARDDLPRVDEEWLRRSCAQREVYREQQRGDFRPEWLHVPALAELITQAKARLDADTRIALCEVSISFIPITEIVFDLGDVRPKPQPAPAAKQKKGAKPLKSADAGLYSWYIYGFERRLPKDWRFLNWDRVGLLIATALSLVLLLVLVGLAIARVLW